MQIISISWVRNEADIIATFARHHAQIVDRMVIIDNASTDATPDILEALQAEGLPIELRRDPSAIHRQGEALTTLMHELDLTDTPDWIIPLDADEFLTGNDVRTSIAGLPTDRVLLIPWRTYVPTESDDPTEHNVLKRITHRRSTEQPQYRKILIPRMFHGISYTIPLGSHELTHATSDVPMQILDTVSLAHFPVRSPQQIRRKVIDSWERHKNDPSRKAGQNYHWEKLYNELAAGFPSDTRFREIARQYAMPEPLPVDTVYDPITH